MSANVLVSANNQNAKMVLNKRLLEFGLLSIGNNYPFPSVYWGLNYIWKSQLCELAIP